MKKVLILVAPLLLFLGELAAQNFGNTVGPVPGQTRRQMQRQQMHQNICTERVWVPGHWITNQFGHRHFVNGHWVEQQVPCQPAVVHTPPPAWQPAPVYAPSRMAVAHHIFAFEMRRVQAASFSSDKLRIAMHFVQNNAVTSQQVHAMVSAMNFENHRLQVAQTGWHNVIDPHNFDIVFDALAMRNSRLQLERHIQQHPIW